MSTTSVVLLSGGLDSSANLAFCAKYDHPVLALTADYGQRSASREIEAASALASHFGVEHRVVNLQWLGALGGNALTDTESKIPELERGQLDDDAVTRGSARAVWVPNRNGVLINVGAAYAEAWKAKRIVVGFNREEAATFPDNSTEYLVQASHALSYSTSNQSTVHCYTDRLSKSEIVLKLRAEIPDFPKHLVWSCYHGGAEPCGRCESCGRYRRAFESWGT